MCKLFIATLLLLAIARVPVRADEFSETIEYYVARSRVAISGTISTVKQHDKTDRGLARYTCELTQVETLAGSGIRDRTLTIEISRREMSPEDQPLFLKGGYKVILFLQEAQPSSAVRWRTADPWFGVQQFNSEMAAVIRNLSSRKDQP